MSDHTSPFDSSNGDTPQHRGFNPQPGGERSTPAWNTPSHAGIPPTPPRSPMQPLHLPARPAPSSGGLSAAQRPSVSESPSSAGLFSFQQAPTQAPEEHDLSANAVNPLPLQSAPTGKRRHGRRRIKPLLAVGLVLVALLVIAGGIVGQRFLPARITSVMNSGAGSSKATSGNFVTPPLSNQQIDNLRHLTDHMKEQQLAYLYVSRMSLDEEIGQIMMVEYSEDAYSPSLDAMIHDLHAGGVIMYQRQINTLEQTKADTTHMQQRALTPLLISADEEGWNVHRLTNIYPPRLSAKDIHDSKSTTVAANEGTKVAHDLLSLGINTNFAPDVDVSTDDGYIGYDARSFGSTPDDVIKYVGPYTKAMQTGGVIATMKHFPGLGGAPKSTDPHAVFVTVNHTKDQVYNIDLAPFQHFIHATDKMEQPGIIMSTDVLVPSIDPTYISELSPTFMTQILRKEMGYQGVAVTDALTMLGVQVNGQHLDLGTAGVMALKAGNDLLLGPGDPASMRSMVDAIKTALNNGTLSKSRLDEAASRVIALKMQRHLLPDTPPPSNP